MITKHITSFFRQWVLIKFLLIYLRETGEIGKFALRKCVKCTKGLTGTKGLIGRYSCRCNKLY